MTRALSQVAALAIVVAMGSVARAEPAPASPESGRLLREAEALAKAGEYERAIAVYRRADQVQARAEISCFIGLAYVRRAAWAQAELAFDACRSRATDADPSPPWLNRAQRELDSQIRVARVPAVTFRVYPEKLTVQLAIVGWPAGESFAPRMLHLPAGRYSVDAAASGGPPVRTDFEVTAATQTVEIYLRPVAKLVTELPATDSGLALRSPAGGTSADSPRGSNRRSRVVAYALLGGGGLAVAAGAVSHVLAVRDRERMQTSAEAWDANRAAFNRDRMFAIGGYAIGAALAAVGTYWLVRDSNSERAVAVAPLVPAHAGGTLGLALEWSR